MPINNLTRKDGKLMKIGSDGNHYFVSAVNEGDRDASSKTDE